MHTDTDEEEHNSSNGIDDFDDVGQHEKTDGSKSNCGSSKHCLPMDSTSLWMR